MNSHDAVRIDSDWLKTSSLVRLFEVLEAAGGEVRVSGGAIRNTLMGHAVSDVDVATTLVPEQVVSAVDLAGMKAVPTGVEHGTVTVVVDDVPYEVTTLREDIETDGRHAVVRFGVDWQADAMRRDVTMNALFCDREGNVQDFVGGLEDIKSGTVRFIGDAETRIREDALRILRFFRFFAWYGDGRPDAGGLKAVNRTRDLINGLSVERVWMELKKLLAAPDPARALLWMRTTGVLSRVLPETEKWGIDAIPGLIRIEREKSWQVDPMLRLMAMVRPDEAACMQLASRLKLSRQEQARLTDWAKSKAPQSDVSEPDLEKMLYQGSKQGMADAIRLEIVHLENRDDAAGSGSMTSLLELANNWKRPQFPLKGEDLIDEGMQEGPEVGKRLRELEAAWVESGFKLQRDDLLSIND